jgi:6-phosphogluconate dehydrogenase
MQNPDQMVANIQNEIFNKSDIGLISLGVMGKSLSRNFVSKGFSLSNPKNKAETGQNFV